jgi:hypothetical protein
MDSLGALAMKTTHAQPRPSRRAGWARRDTGLSDNARSVGMAASSLPRWGGQGCLPSEVEQLLRDVVADGFVLYCCGPRAAPRALVASYQWQDYVDLLTIRCFDRIITARIPAPQHARIDVFAPTLVVWAYEGAPQPALQALLSLVAPHHPQAPTRSYPAPAGLHIPRAEQRPMTIQLPPPHCIGNRATRLTTRTDRVETPPR